MSAPAFDHVTNQAFGRPAVPSVSIALARLGSTLAT